VKVVDFAQNVKLWFDVDRFSGKVVTFLSVLLTFGAAYPPLGLVICFTLTAMTYRMQFRYTSIIGRVPVELRTDYVAILDLQSKHLVSYIRKSVWMMLTAACLFYTLFVFDAIGDQVGFSGALWAPILVMLVPPAIWLYDHLHNREAKEDTANVRAKSEEPEDFGMYALDEDPDKDRQSYGLSIALQSLSGITSSKSRQDRMRDPSAMFTMEETGNNKILMNTENPLVGSIGFKDKLNKDLVKSPKLKTPKVGLNDMNYPKKSAPSPIEQQIKVKSVRFDMIGQLRGRLNTRRAQIVSVMRHSAGDDDDRDSEF
jgi:hypothetical protein